MPIAQQLRAARLTSPRRPQMLRKMPTRRRNRQPIRQHQRHQTTRKRMNRSQKKPRVNKLRNPSRLPRARKPRRQRKVKTKIHHIGIVVRNWLAFVSFRWSRPRQSSFIAVIHVQRVRITWERQEVLVQRVESFCVEIKGRANEKRS